MYENLPSFFIQVCGQIKKKIDSKAFIFIIMYVLCFTYFSSRICNFKWNFCNFNLIWLNLQKENYELRLKWESQNQLSLRSGELVIWSTEKCYLSYMIHFTGDLCKTWRSLIFNTWNLYRSCFKPCLQVFIWPPVLGMPPQTTS